MASVTLRDIPPELHQRLKREAAGNGRSLNQEILFRLRSRPAPDEVLALTDQTREMTRRLRLSVTTREVNRWKRQGRP